MFDPSLGSAVCNLFIPASRNLGNLQHIWLPHELLHRLIWLKNIWKLATQICHRCTLKDQVHLIAKTSATELAHPLMSRHARLAANVLW